MKKLTACLALFVASFGFASAALASPASDFSQASRTGKVAYCAALNTVLANRLVDHIEAHGTPTPEWLKTSKDSVVDMFVTGSVMSRMASKLHGDEIKARRVVARTVPADYRDAGDYLAVQQIQCAATYKQQLEARTLRPAEVRMVSKKASDVATKLAAGASHRLLAQYKNKPMDSRVSPARVPSAS